jgi:Ca2+-binding RTX toxin-like protein
MKAKTLCSVFVVVLFSLATFGSHARTLGMVADNDTDSVIVFDADTHAVLGTVSIDPGDPFLSGIGDVLITPDLKRGFVTNRSNQVFVIDLTTSPPTLAGGTNPIPISNLGNDLSISPDGKFLVVSNGGFLGPAIASVIDIAAQAEISTGGPMGGFTTSVDVCSDSSVLVTTIAKLESAKVHRLTLSGTGTLTDTGEVLSESGVSNVYCAPGARSGVAMYPATSFTIPGLSEVHTRSSSEGNAFSGTFNRTGDRLFVRGGSIDVFDFNPITGELGASPLLTFSVGSANEFPGFDQIALHPNGSKLFVSEPGAVSIYDPNTGAFLASITDPNIVTPTGVTIVAETDPCALPPPAGAIVGTSGPDILNGTPFGDTIFGLDGPDIMNGRGGNDLICGGAGSDLITGGAGSDTLNTQDGVSGNDSASGGAGNDVCTGDPGDALSSCNP